MKVNYILFTDGSVRRLRTGECISGYGIVVVDTTTKQYTCFGGDIRTTSIVYAEAWAIYRGLHFISKITKTRNVKPHVLVVSDSKLNVSILGDLIPNTWDLSDWDNWKKKDGNIQRRFAFVTRMSKRWDILKSQSSKINRIMYGKMIIWFVSPSLPSQAGESRSKTQHLQLKTEMLFFSRKQN